MDRYYKSSDQVLTVDRKLYLRGNSSGDYARLFTYVFDFEFKTMSVIADSEYRDLRTEKVTTLPFSQVDEKLLADMHEKLMSLGGTPSPLQPPADLKPQLSPPAGGIRPAPKDTP